MDAERVISNRSWLLLALVWSIAILGACASPPEALLHRAHREYFALQPAELERARYFVSDRIVAHELVDGVEGAKPSQVLVLETETPGIVTDVGPDWLRVSFGEGPGVLFVARPDEASDSWYQIASEPEPGGQPLRVRDGPDSIVQVGDRRYKVIFGSEARLMIEADALRELIESRPRAPGRNPE
jgi:hypothetical protein